MMLQWIAMLTMLIDHIGAVWFEDQIIYRIIGRMAFPIYAFYVVQGMHLTSNRKRYMIRLGLLALLSQLPYSLLFDTLAVNVIGTFFLCVLALYGFMETRLSLIFRGTCLLGAVVLLEVLRCDYGVYALILMIIYTYTRGFTITLGHVALNIAYIGAGLTSLIQAWSVLPSILFSLNERIVARIRHSRSPKLLWRSFYPLHLLALLIVRMIMGS